MDTDRPRGMTLLHVGVFLFLRHRRKSAAEA